MSSPPERDAADIKYLLVSPPLTDPTTPYHSISYLIGPAAAAGFTGFRACDANVDALNCLARPENVRQTLMLAGEVRACAEAKDTLSRNEQLRYQTALKHVGLSESSIEAAIAVFKDAEQFYDYDRYRQAVMVVKRWMDLLALAGPTGLLDGFEIRTKGPVNLCSIADVSDDRFLDAVEDVIRPYVEGPFAALLAQESWDVIGFSVSYLSQLPFALVLARAARAARPDAVIVFGGTEVSDDVKFLRRMPDIWNLYRHADVIVPGEGETAFLALLEAVRSRTPLSHDLRGLLVKDAPRAPLAPPVVYEDVAGLAGPRYDIWDWSQYWSPESVLLYSPTRGCYWNKCTFCDYGLNTDRPTSPSRERPIPRVLEDLTRAADIGKTVYFAVDAMSPAYLRRLCEALAESPLSLQWSGELRLERTFPKQGMGAKLRAAGCLAISFGYESGVQRILDLIDKGTRIREVPGVLQELASAGIGAQLMGFTGFPTEKPQEAGQTFQFLLDHEELWAVAGIGEFVLTRGSHIARQAEHFRVKPLENPPVDDILRWVPWEPLDNPQEESLLEVMAVEEENKKLAQRVLRLVDDRPFVGGIDSAHTMLYFARHGRQLVPDNQAPSPLWEPLVATAHYTTPFSHLDTFTAIDELEDFHAQCGSSGGATAHKTATWLQTESRIERSASGTQLEVFPSGRAMPAEPSLFEGGAAYQEVKHLLLRSRGVT
ncbi:B12-binding domain-containing radical SAM protein [Streptomyces phaeochromogenes]|uniref:B12-binding domain-containing radical SAM protein n=1 Tax=Streptomyces phaeochromogenes TaxID=1923 RepID=UPI00340E8D78